MGSESEPRYRTAATAVIIPVLSIVSILVSLVPLALHWKNRNFPATCLIGWFLVLNLFNIVNAIIWPNDDVDSWFSGVGLCDVEVKIMIASYVAVAGNLLGIFRGLANVLDTSRANLVPSKKQRWQNHFMDILFCVIIPIIAMITHIIFQANRYMLFAISGCVNSFDESWVSFVLSFVWPPIICLITGYYCSLVLYRLHKYRSQFGDVLQSSNSNISKSRFLRLFLLSFTMLLVILPTQAFVVWKNVTLSLPWHSYSWNTLHGPMWNEIAMIPTNGEVFFDRWIPIASGFMFFLFFGCGRDASNMYASICRSFGLECCLAGGQTSSAGTTSSTAVGTMHSRVRLLFRKKTSSATRVYVSNVTSVNPVDRSYVDLENRTATPQSHGHMHNLSWIQRFFPFSRHRSPRCDDMVSLHDLSGPSSTVATNAWAGASTSRGSNEYKTSTRKDFIRVKQVISQESEKKM
ncbi:STE3-domain-containing protein [Aspergillus steynii IBT 23096]|uniref:STE3-domain-containing protein n=1 Tax=Aspergillus steynii IBT 23096 TaxID=1392250 RepID=A0A2I2GL95_9EURO|nr:STE3-domain-containing protein [Aspergillus steynii IBT 23096]PLB53655.1 STE3-domain-containing protein [Aspergillus steynii IBT 23096]